MATLSHMNPKYHGLDANEFDGNRWCASSNTKQAVTVSPSYYPFGLGRWACPGRVLAVAGGFFFSSFSRGASVLLDPGLC